MSDPITPTNATPEPTPEKTQHLRSVINQALANEIALGGEVATTAAKTDYAAALAQEGIDAAFVTALQSLVAEATDLIASSGDWTNEKKTDTANEEAARATLMELISIIHARAKRKYPQPGDPGRDGYYIGVKFAGNRALLEASSQGIINRLAVDTLPGMQTGDIPALVAARAAYIAAQSSQTADQSHATTTRAQCEAKVKDLSDKRRKVQYAVDAIWPSTRPANAGVRIEFKLRPDHPMK